MISIMKLILLIAIVGFSSTYAYLADADYGEKFLSLTKIWHDKCVPITGVTQATIDELKKGNFTENETLKRYTLCLWLVSDVMSPDYTLNTNSLKEYMPKKLTEGVKTYLGCAKTAKESDSIKPHDKIWGMMKCLYNADPEGFIMF